MSMQTILAASQSMIKMQTMQSARTQMQGEANVLRIESKQDEGNEKKLAQAAALDEKSNSLMGDLMSEATEVNETLRPDQDVDTEADAEEEAGKPPKTDTLELSDSAAQYISEEAHGEAVVGEAVTYNADGNTAPSAPAQSSPVLGRA